MPRAAQVYVLAETNADVGVHGSAAVLMALAFIGIGVALVVWPGRPTALIRRLYLFVVSEERYDALVGGRDSRQERRVPQLLGWFLIVVGAIFLFNA